MNFLIIYFIIIYSCLVLIKLIFGSYYFLLLKNIFTRLIYLQFLLLKKFFFCQVIAQKMWCKFLAITRLKFVKEGCKNMSTYFNEAKLNEDATKKLIVACADANRAEVEKIIANDPNIKQTILEKNNQGDTALHVTATGGDHYILQNLLEAGGDLTVSDKQGRTPLMKASLLGSFFIPSSSLPPFTFIFFYCIYYLFIFILFCLFNFKFVNFYFFCNFKKNFKWKIMNKIFL